MVCCTLYTGFRVILLNAIVTSANLLLFFVGFGSNQWATYETGNSCNAYSYIGLFQSKYGDCNKVKIYRSFALSFVE
jgi:hypothetical protein